MPMFFAPFFFSRHPASRLKKGNKIRFRISCFFVPVFYSAWHDRKKCRIPSGKSVNSPILLMMGAAVDDALRRLQSKDESFAVAARWERLSFSWSLERVASSHSDAPGNSKCQCFSPRFFFLPPFCYVIEKLEQDPVQDFSLPTTDDGLRRWLMI